MDTLRRVITATIVACALVSLAGTAALAGGGQAKVEAAKAKGMPVLIDFGKNTCTQCQKMMPVLDELGKKYKGRMEVVFIHVDEEREYAQRMGATMIPSQVLIDKDGREVSRHVGFMSMEDCEKFIGGTPLQPGKTDAREKTDGAGAFGTTGKTCTPGKACTPGSKCK